MVKKGDEIRLVYCTIVGGCRPTVMTAQAAYNQHPDEFKQLYDDMTKIIRRTQTKKRRLIDKPEGV